MFTDIDYLKCQLKWHHIHRHWLPEVSAIVTSCSQMSRNMHMHHIFSCLVVGNGQFSPCPPGLLHWHWSNHMIGPLSHWPLGDFKLILCRWFSTLANGGWCMSHGIVLRWMPLDLTGDKSTLVQVMAWCRQATSHYMSQCWPRSISPNGVTRPQWVLTEEQP